MATYDITTTTPSKIKTGDILNCPYSGTYKTLTLPKGQYKLECWGAQGGDYSTTYLGGKGGYSTGTLTLTQPTILFFYTGGQGIKGTTTGDTSGGFNGGGKAYTTMSYYLVCSGGGSSDIRIGQDSLYARVIVAGGGGGAYGASSGYGNGGAGGGTAGIDGVSTSTSYTPGKGGTQTDAGASYYGTTANSTLYGTLAAFGLGGAAGTSGYTCGGGSGWFGGGYARRAGGGGGSGYIYTSSTAANYPSGCLLNSLYYLANAQTIAGDTSFTSPTGTTETGHAGDGYIRITATKVSGVEGRIKVNGAWKEIDSVYVKVNGTWKEADSLLVKVNGTWKET